MVRLVMKVPWIHMVRLVMKVPWIHMVKLVMTHIKTSITKWFASGTNGIFFLKNNQTTNYLNMHSCLIILQGLVKIIMFPNIYK